MTLPRAWDAFDAYLFDIDGTLLQCTDAVHYFAFCNVLSNVAGRQLNLDGVTAHGNTDIGILRDAFELAGVAADRWRPRLEELRASLCDHVDMNKADLRIRTLPQVREVLLHLRAKGALLSVATGNLERIGKRKLAAADLLPLFDLGAWSDSFEDRESVFRHAVAQIRAALHPSVSILAVGDTPVDIAAARANGIPVIAVATGIYSYERLTSEQPSLCIRSFADLLQ